MRFLLKLSTSIMYLFKIKMPTERQYNNHPSKARGEQLNKIVCHKFPFLSIYPKVNSNYSKEIVNFACICSLFGVLYLQFDLFCGPV